MINLRELLQQIKPYVLGWIGQSTTYTPVLTASVTNPTLGSGSAALGRYSLIGDIVLVDVYISFGSSPSAGSGTYQISLPITASTIVAYQGIGFGSIYDNSGSASQIVNALINNTDNNNAILTYQGGVFVTHAAPFAWAASDNMKLTLIYKRA